MITYSLSLSNVNMRFQTLEMTANATYQIVLIPKLTEAHEHITGLAEKFRAFRLGALLKSPDAFASTYEVENQRGLDHSIQRLISPKAAQYVALRRATKHETPRSEGEAIERLLKDDWVGLNVLLGPEEGDELSGPSASLERTTPGLWPPNTSFFARSEGPLDLHFHINGMYVDPSTRGAGLGKALMEAVLQRADAEAAKVSGKARVSLSVYDHNTAARGLYEKAGFQVVKQGPSRSKPGSIAVHMQTHRDAAPR